MSNYLRIAFTSSPSLAVSPRLVLTEGIARVSKADFSLGAPSLSGSPGQSGVEWGFRDLKFRVRIRGTRTEATNLLQKIAREVLRAENWILVQLGPEDIPVWYRTYRTQPGELDLTNDQGQVADDRTVGQWTISVPLSADPWSYGEQETIGPVTIANNPAAGTNRCRYVLPAIKGDAPTPLTISYKPSGGPAGAQPFFAVVRSDTAVPPITWKLTGLTPFVGGDASEVDATASGGVRAQVDFSTFEGMATRFQGAAPTTPPPGRYKVLARVSQNNSDCRFRIRLLQFGGGIERSNGVTAEYDPYDGTITWQLVDLGEFTFPFGGNGWGEEFTPIASQIAVQLEYVSGDDVDGRAAIDYLTLIPVDTYGMSGVITTISRIPSASFGDDWVGVWDGDLERFRGMAATTGQLTDRQAEIRGGFPTADPNQVNVLHLHQMMADPTIRTSDAITHTAEVTFSYHPRYSNLAGDE